MYKPEKSGDYKTVSLTKFMFSLPSSRRSLLYLIAISLIYGFTAEMLARKSLEQLGNALTSGAMQGFILLAIPAIISIVIAEGLARLKRDTRENGIKYFAFTALVSATIAAASYLLGKVLGHRISTELEVFALLANSIIFIIWFVAANVILSHDRKKAIAIAAIQPILNLSLFIIWNALVLLNYQSVWLIALKFLMSTTILALALAALFYLINAPAKYNFGISAIDSITLFFSQWMKGNKGLEELFAEIGERVEVEVAVIAFKSKNDKYKALLVTPQLHYGPIGNIAGSELPAIISKNLREKFSCPAFVFHSTTNHDFNPAFSDVSITLTKTISNAVAEMKDFQEKLGIAVSTHNESKVFGITFGQKAFLTLTRAPSSSEDIDLGIGVTLTQKARAIGKFQEAFICDRHNSKTDGHIFTIASKEYWDYMNAIEKLKFSDKYEFKTGSSFDPLKEFTLEDGIGKAGLNVMTFETGGKKNAFILIDANNCIPEFRESVIKAFKQKYGFSFIDLFTTDSHAVNVIGGIHNPLGVKTDNELLLQKIGIALENAMKNMQSSKVAMKVEKVHVTVLGAKRMPEVVSTVNSIVSIVRVLAPVMIGGSILAAFLLLRYIN